MRRNVIALLVIAGLTLQDGSSRAASATGLAQAAGPGSYRLTETWAGEDWRPRAGAYRDAVDIASAADGTLYLLDSRYVAPYRYAALHRIAPDGRPLGFLPLATRDARLAPSRLDVGADGTLYILWTPSEGRRAASARLEHLRPSGELLDSWYFDEAYTDVAARADGRFYLTRNEDSVSLGFKAVDVYDARGQRLESIRPPELDTPIRVDIDADDTIYVLQEVPPPPVPREPGGPRPPPGPSGVEATSARSESVRPPADAAFGVQDSSDPDRQVHASAVRGRSDSDAPAQQVDPVPGVIIFEPNHAYRKTVPFDFGIDVDAGPAGVFVARYGQVFALGEDAPLSPMAGQTWTGQLSLEVPAGGGVYGSLSHCAFEGMIQYRQPQLQPEAPFSLHGGMDHPALEGPAFPQRIAAGKQTVLLQGRFGPSPIEDQGPAEYVLDNAEPQSVQRWQAGKPVDQLGLCHSANAPSVARDLALDASTVYVADASCVESRPGDGFAAWSRCLDGLWGANTGTMIAALAADGGRVALLDQGAGAVVQLDRTGTLVEQWQLAPDPDGRSSVLVDIDIDFAGGRIALADSGRRRVLFTDLAGRALGEIALPDSPESLAFDEAGALFVLTRGGWGLRYLADGVLDAVWRLPVPDMPLRDLAVDDAGRVLVSFARAEANNGRFAPIEDAGVWVFEPETEPPKAFPPGPGACEAIPDKFAAPARIPLGDSVAVSLTVDGSCPSQPAPLSLVIAFDTSRSMGWGYALDKAKRAVTGLLAQLDAGRAEVGLVTFDDVEALAAPPSRDLQDLARSVAALRARGDTQMAGAINLARQHLADDPSRAGLRRAILVVTDANPSDATVAALQAAADEGIALAAIVVEDGQPADPAFLDALELAGGRLVFDPAAWELPGLAESLLGLRAETGIFENIQIVDDIPDNMRYIADSARPPAVFDAAANRLTWTLGAVSAASGVRLDYRLEPQEVGVWPTNLRAGADYRDALGSPGKLIFPVPIVEVVGPGRFLAYLPLLSRGHCPRPERPVDVVLVIDTSSSMAEPAEGAEAGGATKLDAAREAAATFVGLLDLPGDRAAVVAFDAVARRELGLTGDAAALQAALARLATDQGTRIDFGLAEAASLLAESGRPAALPVVVVLTDGLQAGEVEPVHAAAKGLKDAGARIYAIGLGAAIDEGLLQAVASSPDRFYSSPNTDELGRIYAEISQRLACERP